MYSKNICVYTFTDVWVKREKKNEPIWIKFCILYLQDVLRAFDFYLGRQSMDQLSLNSGQNLTIQYLLSTFIPVLSFSKYSLQFTLN